MFQRMFMQKLNCFVQLFEEKKCLCISGMYVLLSIFILWLCLLTGIVFVFHYFICWLICFTYPCCMILIEINYLVCMGLAFSKKKLINKLSAFVILHKNCFGFFCGSCNEQWNNLIFIVIEKQTNISCSLFTTKIVLIFPCYLIPSQCHTTQNLPFDAHLITVSHLVDNLTRLYDFSLALYSSTIQTTRDGWH